MFYNSEKNDSWYIVDQLLYTSNEPTALRGLGNRKLVDYPLETIDVGDSKTIDWP